MRASNLKNCCLISGGSVSGELMACALAQSGVPSAIIAPEMPVATPSQARTITVWRGGLEHLYDLFGHHDFLDGAHPIRAMVLVDEIGEESYYLPEDIGLEDDYFGYNLALAPLTERAHQANTLSDLVQHHPTRTRSLGTPGLLRTEDHQELTGRLVIVAEGKDSPTARQAGINPICYHANTVAIIAIVRHNVDHEGFAREYHRRPGPLAFVPLDAHHSSIVWIQHNSAETNALSADSKRFLSALNRNSFEQLEVEAITETPRIIPLVSRQTCTFRAPRLALIGESAHKMPPTGAQGLNLTLRDIAKLRTLVSTAYHEGQDIGAHDLLRAYSADRLKDTLAVSTAVHIGNASIRLGGPAAWLRRTLQNRVMPQFPKLQQSLIRRALYGF